MKLTILVKFMIQSIVALKYPHVATQLMILLFLRKKHQSLHFALFKIEYFIYSGNSKINISLRQDQRVLLYYNMENIEDKKVQRHM
jgi:hypothetical protein